MKLNYRKPVLLISPDQDSRFHIVEAVIMAETGSPCYNLAFVRTRLQHAGKSHAAFVKLGLSIKASHTHGLTPAHTHTHTHTLIHSKAQRKRKYNIDDSLHCLIGLPQNQLPSDTHAHTHAIEGFSVQTGKSALLKGGSNAHHHIYRHTFAHTCTSLYAHVHICADTVSPLSLETVYALFTEMTVDKTH